MTTARRPTAAASGDGQRAQRSRRALVALVALAIAACDSDESDQAAGEPVATTTVATTSPTEAPTEAPTTVATTSPPVVTAVPADQAVERAEAYLAAFAGGDVDAVLGMQTDDFVMRSAFGNEGPGERSLTDWMGVVYQTALRTDYADLECEAGDEDTTVTVVDCNAAMVTTIHDETDSPGVPTSLAIAVREDGIAGLDSRYLENFRILGFYEWRDLRHDALDGDPATIEEVTELGRLDSELAAEYASFGVTAVEETFDAFNAAELDGFLAHFANLTTIFGVRWSEAPDVYGALMAGGQRYELSGCQPAGISGLGLGIGCEVTVLPALGSSGVEGSGTVSAQVAIDGIVERISDTIDFDATIEFRTGFKEWLATSHPDVHGQIEWLLDLIPSADDHELVAPYYDDYVAQSDAYPVDP